MNTSFLKQRHFVHPSYVPRPYPYVSDTEKEYPALTLKSFKNPPTWVLDPIKFEFVKSLIDFHVLHMHDKDWNTMINSQLSLSKPDDIVAFISEQHNLSIVDALLNLVAYFEINPELIFEVFPSSNDATISEHYHYELIPSQLIIDGYVYELMERDQLLSYNGSPEQCVCTYCSPFGEKFHVMATVYQRTDGYLELNFGQAPIRPKFFSSDQINKERGKTICLFLDLSQSLAMRRFAREAKYEESIISGYYGGIKALDVLDYSIFLHSTIAIIVYPTAAGLKEAELLHKKLTTAGAKDVQFFLGTIKISSAAPIEDVPNLPTWKQFFLSKTIEINAGSIFSLIIEQIGKECIEIHEYEKWKENHALSTPSQGKHAHESKMALTPFFAIGDVARDPQQAIEIYEFLTPNFTTLLYAPSDIGKTWVAIYLMLCFIFGLPVFFLAAPQSSKERRKVLYLNGEAGYDGEVEIKSRIKQLCQYHGIDTHTLKDYCFIHKLDADKKLHDKNTQAELSQMIVENEIKLIIIDNVSSLAPKANRGGEVPLLNYIDTLKSIGIAVLIVHHTNKKGKEPLGSSSLQSLSQNIITLHPLEGNELETHKTSDEGAIYFKMAVEKCKVASNPLKGKYAIYTVPTNGGFKHLEGTLPHFESLLPVATLPQDDITAIDEEQVYDSHEEFVNSLNRNQRKVYDFMKEKKRFRAEDIDNFIRTCTNNAGEPIEVNPRTITNWLKNFIDANIITRHGGKGDSNTYYTFNG